MGKDTIWGLSVLSHNSLLPLRSPGLTGLFQMLRARLVSVPAALSTLVWTLGQS